MEEPAEDAAPTIPMAEAWRPATDVAEPSSDLVDAEDHPLAPPRMRPARPQGLESGATVFGRVPFAHPAEAEFARLLDFYRIGWLYEPTSFPLSWAGERVTEMFTPDFYLPEHDLYVELTTMKQSLISRKHRKIRRFQEVYPEAKVQLLTRRDYHALLARVGYAAVDITSLPEADIARVLASPAEIAARVGALGAEISRDYADRSLVLVGLLKGVTFFLADLARAISRPLAIDFLAVTRPTGHGGTVAIERDLDLQIRGRHVLLIEDIVNTGLTLDFVLKHLTEREPASLAVCALFDKRERRLVDVPVRYTGFAIPNAYVVGYGLDHRELYRNLPFLCELRPEACAQQD